MKKTGFIVALFIMTTTSFADDDPTVVLDTEQYDKKMCVERIAGDCVNTICLTSEARDCTDKCQAEAEEKCGVQTEAEMPP